LETLGLEPNIALKGGGGGRYIVNPPNSYKNKIGKDVLYNVVNGTTNGVL
jgi:hypothetical protein